MISYKLTDEGLAALVEGKLALKKNPNATDKSFFVGYNALVVSPDARTITFLYDHVPIFKLELPELNKGDTCTVEGLDGCIPLTISN